MDNDFHPPLRDPRMLRLGRIFKQRWLPPAYLMDQTVQFLKESAPNTAWICKRGQLFILMRVNFPVKEIGSNTVVFDYRGKSFVLRFHQTPGIARPLRGYTVSTGADEWLLPLVKRFGLVQQPVHATTEMVKWNTAWCAPRFDPRKTPITSPKYQNGELFLLYDIKSEPVNIRSLGRHCKWGSVLYFEGHKARTSASGVFAALDGSLAAAPRPARIRTNCQRGQHEAHGGHLLRPQEDAGTEHFNVFGPKVCHRIAQFVHC